MFKKETITALTIKAKAIGQEIKYSDHEKLHVTISKGNTKIGKVMNVSIMPILSCGNCSQCMLFCYDVKACIQYVNVLYARMKNLFLASVYRDRYFSEIDAAMNRRRCHKSFRWHVGGEIPDFDYFCRMVENAKRHPDFVIWTYTKMYHIVNKYCDLFGRDAIPENFCIMFSEWDGTEMDNPYNFPIFTCKLKDGNKNHDPAFFETLWKCPGNCDICKAAGRGCIAKESTYADEH